jgi:2-polyprenyl-3-methyl-5-hydroxy-6-metoxy-1,4-benzoquinol methylase
MTATDTTPEDLEAEIGAFAERLFTDGLAAIESFTIALGRELGLYEQLAAAPTTTPPELAARAGMHPRYAREWLEQQASAGLIDVGSVTDEADQRQYSLSPAKQECLIRPESLASVGPLFDFAPSLGRIFTTLADAFRSGSGVPYADYAIHDAQGDFNRPVFLSQLSSEWLPAAPGAVERLSGGARVAEIGCGEGWAAIGIAKAWPNVEVDGFDIDEASIAAARKHAAEAGVADRVRFELVDVTADVPPQVETGTYDIVLAFEMIHDLAKPQAALTTMRRLGKPDAIFVVMDEGVAETFEAPTDNPVERLMYAFSVLHCLPVGMTESPSAGTGTVMRPATFRRYAAEAGFSSVDILPIEHDLFRFYQLVA